MNTQRRPRIPDNLADDVDQLRGREPFESFIREAVAWYVHINSRVAGKGSVRWATGGEKLYNLIASDFWNGDEKQFMADVDEALALWAAELDRQAVEDEHDDTI